MNVLLTRLGCSANFFTMGKSINVGGDNISRTLLNFVKRHPEDEFYYINGSDIPADTKFGKFVDSVDKPKNLHTLYDDWFALCEKRKYKDADALVRCLQNKGLQIDFAIFHVSLKGTTWTGDNNVKMLDGTGRYVNPLITYTCYSPGVYAINKLNIPYFLLFDDPRVVPLARDFFKLPVKCYSQRNAEWDYKHITEYGENSDKITVEKFKEVYSELEKGFFIGREKIPYTNDTFKVDGATYRKKLGLFMPLHLTLDRIKFIEEWIWKYRPETTIYGGCDADSAKYVEGKNYDIQKKPMLTIPEISWQSKYTLVLPVIKKANTFVTQKVYSMIYMGILPFIPKKLYDVDRIYSELPDYLYVETPEEFNAKIDELEANPKLYKELLNKIYSLLTDDLFDGSKLDKIIYQDAVAEIRKIQSK